MNIVIREPPPEDAGRIAEAHIEGRRTGYRGLVPDAFLDSTAFADARQDGWRLILSGQLLEALGRADRVFVPVVSGRVAGFGHSSPSEPAKSILFSLPAFNLETATDKPVGYCRQDSVALKTLNRRAVYRRPGGLEDSDDVAHPLRRLDASGKVAQFGYSSIIPRR